jgi:hypothetical protein
LTLQNNGFEQGGTVAGAGGSTLFVTGPAMTPCTSSGSTMCGHQPSTGANESLVYNVGALGWLTGANVGIGLDTNETGNVAGLTFDTLVLTLYNSAGVALGSFSGDGPTNITAAQLAAQQGNGNSVFDIGLSTAEQLQYNAILAANGGAANVFEGLNASFGCGTSPPANCLVSTDGAESFLAFNAVPGPIAGAGLPGLAGLLLLGFAKLRQRTNAWRNAREAAAH